MQERHRDLSKYGHTFNCKLLASLITDTLFVSQIFDVLKLDYFKADSSKWVVENTIKYYHQYKKLPTMEVFKVLYETIDGAVLKNEVVSLLHEVIKQIESEDLEFIKETTINFCKNQEIKNAIIKSVDLLREDDFEKIQFIINQAFKVGLDTNIGLNYLEDIDTRYEEEARDPIATGWKILNSLLKGGLSKGELGLFIANSGIGKSWLLAHIGASAVRNGKVVLHISLELNQSYTGLRYDSILSGITLEKLPLHRDLLKDALEELNGKLYIKWYAMKSISLVGIKAYIDKVRSLGINPDLIIIDYLDLTKYTGGNTQEDRILGELYAEAKGLAGEVNLPIWTVSQANRAGLEDDILEAGKISGAYAKVFPADFVGSVSRKRLDKASNTGRMHVIKNRFGVDGLTFPMMIDTSRGAIEIYEPESVEGKNAETAMASHKNAYKETAKKHFNEMFKSNNTPKSKF
jgi:replicative DNA helicase